MLKVTIQTAASNYSPECGDLDQPSTLTVESEEVYTFNNRGDFTGMPELALAQLIRTFLRNESL